MASNGFECTKCGKVLKFSGSFRKHIKTHDMTKEHPCKSCSKTFYSQANLKIHNRSHTGEKPYSCKQCQRSFSQQGSVKRHQVKHSKNKPFLCSKCEKRFSLAQYLDLHIERMHDQNRPFKCPECTMAFNKRGNLKVHIKTHNNSKEEKRSFGKCDDKFLNRFDLKEHEKIHSKPYTVLKDNTTVHQADTTFYTSMAMGEGLSLEGEQESKFKIKEESIIDFTCLKEEQQEEALKQYLKKLWTL